MANFVVIVDGEVAGNIPIPDPAGDGSQISNSLEKIIAALSSDPTIVKHDRVEPGYVWNGSTFTAPEE